MEPYRNEQTLFNMFDSSACILPRIYEKRQISCSMKCGYTVQYSFYSTAGVLLGNPSSPLLFLSYIRGRHTVEEALMAQLVLEIDHNI